MLGLLVVLLLLVLLFSGLGLYVAKMFLIVALVLLLVAAVGGGYARGRFSASGRQQRP